MRKIMSAADVRFEYQVPKVQIPESIRSQYNEAQLKELEATCLKQYAQGLVAFDEVLGETLSVDTEVLEFARKLATRMVELIDTATEVEVTEQVTKAVMKNLEEKGLPKDEVNKRAKIEIQYQLELAKNAALSKVIGQKAISGDHSKVAIDFGNTIDQGFSGMSPQSIRNVLKDGNLREVMYILFRPATYYYRDLLLEPHSDKVVAINDLLKKQHNWQLDIPLADDILANCSKEVVKRYGVNAPGAYYTFGIEREERSKKEQERYVAENPAPRFGEVDLSEREKLVHTGEVANRRASTDEDRLPWRSGTAEFKEPTEKKKIYAQVTEASQQRFVASLSGTTDRIMTMSMMLGYGKHEDLITCRKACLGWLLSGKNHSSDEVLVPSKSFHLPYTPGPEGYKDIDPGNDKLIADIKEKLNKKGNKLPPYYLSEKNVEKQAEKLFVKGKTEKKGKELEYANDDEPVDLESKYSFPEVKRFYDEENSSSKVKYPEYQQRHVIGLKGVKDWTATEIQNHKTYNRVFQKEFTDINPDKIIELSLLSKEDWITDWLCPNVEAAAKLNIAADLIVQYQVSADDLNDTAQALLQHIQIVEPKIFDDVSSDVDKALRLEAKVIQKKAQDKFQQKYPVASESAAENADRLAAFVQVETQRRRMAIQNEKLAAALDKIMPTIAGQLSLQPKPIFPRGKNNDFAFLGAPGSGKSTLSNQYISKEDKAKYISLATDDYRGVVIHEEHEKIPTDQVFLRTQDSAYYIKELVQKRVENKPQRPNVILDCVSIEYWHKALLEPSKAQMVSTIACLDDISLVPARAYFRAIDEQSGPADKGRQVNTTSLFKTHQDSSTRLLSTLPPGVKSKLFNTNVKRGMQPLSFAEVDLSNGQRVIEVFDLTRLSNFVCKANVNVNAEYPDELYFTKVNDIYKFTFDKHHQAEQVFNMIKSKPDPRNPAWSKPAYDMVLRSNQHPYAKIVENQYGLLIFDVLDPAIFRQILKKRNNESRALTSLILHIHNGSLNAVRQHIKNAGSEDQAIREAINSVAPRGVEQNLIAKDIPSYDFHVMSSDKTPTLADLNARFGGLDKEGKIKPITVIPLVIKESDNNIWVYGREADGRPSLHQVSRPEIYRAIHFPKTPNEVVKHGASDHYQAIYNNMASHKYHYYNYQALRSEERLRRLTEGDKRSAEYMRQFKEMDVKQPKESKRPRTIMQSGLLAAPRKDVLKDISQIKPDDTNKKRGPKKPFKE